MEKIISAGRGSINFVAQSILVYSIGCFKLSRGLFLRINSMVQKFCWQSKQREYNTYWMSSDVITRPKKLAALGF